MPLIPGNPISISPTCGRSSLIFRSACSTDPKLPTQRNPLGAIKQKCQTFAKHLLVFDDRNFDDVLVAAA